MLREQLDLRRYALLPLAVATLLLANGLGIPILAAAQPPRHFQKHAYVLLGLLVLAAAFISYNRRGNTICIELVSSRITPRNVLLNDTRNLEHILRRLSFSCKRLTYIIEGPPSKAVLYVEKPSIPYNDIIDIINSYMEGIRALPCTSRSSNRESSESTLSCCSIYARGYTLLVLLRDIVNLLGNGRRVLVVDFKNVISDIDIGNVMIKQLGSRLYVSDKLVGLVAALEEYSPDTLILLEPVDLPVNLLLKIAKDYKISTCIVMTQYVDYANKFEACSRITTLANQDGKRY